MVAPVVSLKNAARAALVLSWAACSSPHGYGGSGVPSVSCPSAPRAVTQNSPSQVVVDFGDVPIGEASTLTLVLSSDGSPLVVEGFDTSPPSAAFSFSLPIGSEFTSSGISVPAGFAPTFTGAFAAIYVLTTDSLAVPQLTLTLEGNGVAPTPTLEATPQAIDFGFVQPGSMGKKVLTLKNASAQDVTLTQEPLIQFQPNASQTGQPSPFLPGSDGTTPTSFPYTLAPGASVDFPLAFTPTTLDEFKGTIVISSDAQGQPTAVVSLHGFGGGAILSCSPARLTFGSVGVGSMATSYFNCTNTGTDVPGHAEAALQFTQSDLHSSAKEFSALLPTPTVSLSAGKNVQIAVTFAPLMTSIDQATLTVNSNAGSQQIGLAGVGGLPGICTLSISPPTIDFGQVAQGNSATRSFKISNAGTGICALEGTILDPASDPGFALLAPPQETQFLDFVGDDVQLGLPTSLALDVAFTASAQTVATTASGKVLLFTAQNSTQPNVWVPLSATIVPVCLSITPNSYDFGLVVDDVYSKHWCGASSHSFRLTNICTGDVTVSSAAINPQGDATAQFALIGSLPTFPLVLGSGGELDLNAMFEPSTIGYKAETIDVTTTEFTPTSPYRIALVGDAFIMSIRTNSTTSTGELDYPLATTPETGSISVSVNGAAVPAAGNWTYDASTNSVDFKPGSSADPVAGDLVTITYGLPCSG